MSRTWNRLQGVLSWARLARVRALAGKVFRAQTTAHHDDEMDIVQPYGFIARAKAGAEAVVVSMGSDASQRVVILLADRRYTIALEDGEVAVVDDLGQKVHLTRTGIVVDAPSIKLGASAALGVARATDPVAPNASMAAWITAVSAATTVPAPVGFGTITSGSAVTQSE